jgi:hypothetical protein
VQATRDWETFSSSQGNMIDELPGRAGATLGSATLSICTVIPTRGAASSRTRRSSTRQSRNPPQRQQDRMEFILEFSQPRCAAVRNALIDNI